MSKNLVALTIPGNTQPTLFVDPFSVSSVMQMEDRRNKCLITFAGSASPQRVIGTVQEIMAKLGLAIAGDDTPAVEAANPSSATNKPKSEDDGVHSL